MSDPLIRARPTWYYDDWTASPDKKELPDARPVHQIIFVAPTPKDDTSIEIDLTLDEVVGNVSLVSQSGSVGHVRIGPGGIIIFAQYMRNPRLPLEIGGVTLIVCSR